MNVHLLLLIRLILEGNGRSYDKVVVRGELELVLESKTIVYCRVVTTIANTIEIDRVMKVYTSSNVVLHRFSVTR